MNQQLLPGAPAQERKFSGTAAKLADAARRSGWKLYAGAGVVAAVVLGVVLWSLFGSGTTVRYTTSPVTRGTIARAVVATGTVNPQLTIIVGSYVSGVIQSVSCDYNTRVKKGQVCAEIDPRPYQSAVDQAKANLAVAQAQLAKDRAALAYAKVAFARAASLLRDNAISRDAYDSAKSVYGQAQAQITFDEATVHQRQAALESAVVNLGYTKIISPVDGTVVSRNVTTGQTVAASFQTPTLFLIATDLTKMQVDTNVSESDIGGIKVGNRVTFTVDVYPRRVFEGEVAQVRLSPQTVQNVVTYDVVTSAANADLALKPGMTAATRIVVEQRDDVLRVPSTAPRYRPSAAATGKNGAEAQVWVLRNGRPAAVPVVLGLDDDTNVEIVEGKLQPGDQVITGEQSASEKKTAPAVRFGI